MFIFLHKKTFERKSSSRLPDTTPYCPSHHPSLYENNNHLLDTSLREAEFDCRRMWRFAYVCRFRAEDWMNSIRIVAGAQKTPVK